MSTDDEIVPIICLSVNPKSNTFYIYCADPETRVMHIAHKIQNPLNVMYLFVKMMRAYKQFECGLLKKARRING